MDPLQECPHCGKRTPEENLRCIYCGDRLPVDRGRIGSLRYGRGRSFWVAAVLAFLLFLVWLRLR